MCRSGAFVFTLFLLTSALNAQILPKGNVFVGYSYNRAGTSQPGAFNTDRSNLNGWEVPWKASSSLSLELWRMSAVIMARPRLRPRSTALWHSPHVPPFTRM